MNKMDNDNNIKLDAQLPALRIESSGVSVSATTNSGETQELYYPETVPSGEIVATSVSTLGIELDAYERNQIIEVVDYAKTHKPYVSEFEFSISLKEGFKIKIKREPRKVIKYFNK